MGLKAGGEGEAAGVCPPPPSRLPRAHPALPPQSFTRLTELVLQAHRKELAGLRAAAAPPDLARLEEDEQQPPGGQDSPKSCWC